MTANSEVQSREEATENVKEFDLFVTVMFLEETPAVISPGKLCEDLGLPTTWPVVRNYISPKMAKTHELQYCESRTIRCPWSVDELLYFIFTCFVNIFIAGYCDQHGKSSNWKKWNYEWGVTEKPVAWISRNRKHKEKWRRRRITKWTLARFAGMATRFQGETGG